MNYEQYHQKGGFYAIPVEIFDGLCEEKDELQKENQKLKEQQKEFINYLKSMLENEKDNFSVARVKDVLEKYKEIVGDKQ